MRRSVLFLFLTSFLTAQAAPEVEITTEPHHHLAFANDQVRVFNVDVPPHAETLMHWHRHDYIYVTLGASEVVNAVKGKDPVTVKLRDGQTGFLPGAFAHFARNLSDQPFHIVNIELLQDDKLRHSPAHWDPAHPDDDRGLDILHGGTREILFVKDGVRVSEFELQPGGMVPMHHHAGPHLLVAVSDLDIRSDVEGQGPMPGHFKSGDAKWLPGGYSHTITNTGHHPAKFVTLEFR
jgi:oxalate decarboxylase/phosphoglucose isomerase-like protein (cupin superfamily)